METSLRIVLLLLAAAIVLGIIWDAVWSKRHERDNNKGNRGGSGNKGNNRSNVSRAFQTNEEEFLEEEQAFTPPKYRNNANSKPKAEQHFKKNPFANNNHFSFDSEQDEFDDVILVKPSPKLRNKEEKNETLEKSRDSKSIQSRKEITPSNNENVSYAKDLVILNVMARQPGFFLGKKLVDALQEANLFYGEMNIFHRHENLDGGGRIMFSLASAVEPGIFDISKIESFVTPGLTLFFQMERPNQSIAAFELMLRTAKQLAMRLDAEIKDDAHKFLTLPIIEKYRERVRLGQALQASN